MNLHIRVIDGEMYGMELTDSVDILVKVEFKCEYFEAGVYRFFPPTTPLGCLGG